MADRKIIVHGCMIYRCSDCGTKFVMYLEKGLEEQGCKDWKPVPFMINCPFCSGYHAHDITMSVLPLPGRKYCQLPDGECYFENVPDRDCGKPVYAPNPRRFGEHGG